ncbi:MAG: hypothetical protein NC321_00405 [Clostridium sp.]|nr:hypothetical protein [Clostridium sp.]
MSTLEKTISMMETLPEADLVKIQDLIRELFQQRECELADEKIGRILKPMSEEDFLHDVEIAEKEIANGKYKREEEVFNGLEKRYKF